MIAYTWLHVGTVIGYAVENHQSSLRSKKGLEKQKPSAIQKIVKSDNMDLVLNRVWICIK